MNFLQFDSHIHLFAYAFFLFFSFFKGVVRVYMMKPRKGICRTIFFLKHGIVIISIFSGGCDNNMYVDLL